MTYRYLCFCLLWISLWFTLPVFASPYGVPDFGKNGTAPQSFILNVQEWEKERGALSYGSERFSERFHGFSDRSTRDQSSDTSTRSYSDFLGPRFDIPDSVHGHSDRPDPWWGLRTEGEPMVKDLKEVNRDPMGSP